VEENTHEVTESVEQRMAKLTRILLDAERYEDLRRITQDKEYRKRMLAEYCI